MNTGALRGAEAEWERLQLERAERALVMLRNEETAGFPSISDETVKTHLERLYEKRGASDRAQAVAIALRQNLIE